MSTKSDQPTVLPGKPVRCWINQPSTLQVGHKYHGTNVLAAPDFEGRSKVFFLGGETVSMTVPSQWLSPGWIAAQHGLDTELAGSSADAGACPSVKQQPSLLPAGTVLMPVTLTAENGAKGALIGEFYIKRETSCMSCGCDDEPDDDCEMCNGDGSYVEEIQVPWDVMKDIYAAAVKACAITHGQGALHEL